jgi:D-sedoheptulose 7-phosphate isomerase
MGTRIREYYQRLGDLGSLIEASDANGKALPFEDAIDQAVRVALAAKSRGSRVMFVGNGGSAGIASHMATDWLKNGGFAATCFNDPASLTCIGNDLGYDQVFALPVERLGRQGDLLIAISSSGNSPNIRNAVAAARRIQMQVITLSGFKPGNALRKLGDLNFWVPDGHYGFVEIAHLALCHAILDMAMGWQKVGDLPVEMIAAKAKASTVV